MRTSELKKGDKVTAFWVSDEVGTVDYIDNNANTVDIKYPRGYGMVTEHISRIKKVVS